MTEERDLPSIRRVFVAAAAAFTAIGILRGSVQLIAAARPLAAGAVSVPCHALHLVVLDSRRGCGCGRVALAIVARWRFVVAHAALVSFAAVIGEVFWTNAVLLAFGVAESVRRFRVPADWAARYEFAHLRRDCWRGVGSGQRARARARHDSMPPDSSRCSRARDCTS